MTTNACGFTVRGLLVVIVLLAAAGGYFGFRFFGQLERTQALSMQVMLVNTAIAEERVYEKEKKYTVRWGDLLPLLDRTSVMPVQLSPVPKQPDTYFMGFKEQAVRDQNGFVVQIRLQDDGESGTITARRVGSRWYAYELSFPFPVGEMLCSSSRNRSFCIKLQKTVDALDVKNLVPVKKDEPQESADESKTANANEPKTEDASAPKTENTEKEKAVNTDEKN